MKLFIPGPTTVRKEVLETMMKPLIGHRTKDASDLQYSIAMNMRKVWNTEKEVLLSTSSGTGLMEGAIRSCTAKKAAVFSVGSFGDKWYKIGIQNGLDVDCYKAELGKVTDPVEVREVLNTGDYDFVTFTHNETATGVVNPINEISEVMKDFPDIVWAVDTVSSTGGVYIPVDEWGADIVLTSTQKCLACPPGLALCTVSERALERMETVENRGTYFDLLDLYKTIQKKNYQYPNTPAISLMYALEYQLNYMVNEEGLEQRYSRHSEMAKMVRNWAKENFALFAKEECCSETVTCVENTKNIDVKKLNNYLATVDMTISNGYGDLKDKTFRIGHMGDTTIEDVKELLKQIDYWLEMEGNE